MTGTCRPTSNKPPARGACRRKLLVTAAVTHVHVAHVGHAAAAMSHVAMVHTTVVHMGVIHCCISEMVQGVSIVRMARRGYRYNMYNACRLRTKSAGDQCCLYRCKWMGVGRRKAIRRKSGFL